jgi:hypothetical protein
MSGSLIQLAAKGQSNLYLTQKPEITFFKSVYKRHTNFSIEAMPQYFSSVPNFGNKVSCTLAKTGDLISNGYLVVDLPSTPKFFNSAGKLDEYIKVAWAKNLGYRLIKKIELDIGNKIIDSQLGEWMYIWSELNVTGNENGLYKMTGNTTDFTYFSTTKDSQRLYIPLQFWFCKSFGLALPLISLKYTDVKIHIEFASREEALIVAPSHKIKINENLVSCNQGDILIQKGTNRDIIGIYIDYDFINKELLYLKVQDEFTGELINGKNNKIINLFNDFEITAQTSSTTAEYQINFTTELSLKSAYLLFDYVLLDNQERKNFYNNKLEYIIEQVQYNGEKTINNNSYKCNLNFNNPCKSLIWICQMQNYATSKLNAWNFYKSNLSMEYLRFNNFRTKQILCECTDTNTCPHDLEICTLKKTDGDRDAWNYIDYITLKTLCKIKDLSDYYLEDRQFIIKKAKILLNGQEKVKEFPYQFFSYLENYKSYSRTIDNHVFYYNFGLKSENLDPRGSMNFSKVDQGTLELKLDQKVSYFNPVKLRVYAQSYNILVIEEGLGSLKFIA